MHINASFMVMASLADTYILDVGTNGGMASTADGLA